VGGGKRLPSKPGEEPLFSRKNKSKARLEKKGKNQNILSSLGGSFRIRERRRREFLEKGGSPSTHIKKGGGAETGNPPGRCKKKAQRERAKVTKGKSTITSQLKKKGALQLCFGIGEEKKVFSEEKHASTGWERRESGF